MNRILVIRGGAIGDFILTLPALKALRETYPGSRLEILGYKHIAIIAENRFYAQAVRSIEYGPLSGFFATSSELSPELAAYFAGFDLIISYLYDPDRIFEGNLRRCGVKNIVLGPGRIIERDAHAARQLARPLEELGIHVVDLAQKIFISKEDREFTQKFLASTSRPIIAIHPGSGSREKNWPLENWIELVSGLSLGEPGYLKERFCFVVVSGEADRTQIAQLEHAWKGRDIRFAKDLSLPNLAAILERSIFIGHDSGISHLAAAAGAKCLLLFGPTNPNIWAPRNENVQILTAPEGKLEDLDIAQVRSAVTTILHDTCNGRAGSSVTPNFRSRAEISDAISRRSR